LILLLDILYRLRNQYTNEFIHSVGEIIFFMNMLLGRISFSNDVYSSLRI